MNASTRCTIHKVFMNITEAKIHENDFCDPASPGSVSSRHGGCLRIEARTVTVRSPSSRPESVVAARAAGPALHAALAHAAPSLLAVRLMALAMLVVTVSSLLCRSQFLIPRDGQ